MMTVFLYDSGGGTTVAYKVYGRSTNPRNPENQTGDGSILTVTCFRVIA